MVLPNPGGAQFELPGRLVVALHASPRALILEAAPDEGWSLLGSVVDLPVRESDPFGRLAKIEVATVYPARGIAARRLELEPSGGVHHGSS